MIKAKKSKLRNVKIRRRDLVALTYLDFGVLLSEHSNAELSSVFTDARMNSRLWLSAYVSEAQVSRMIAPVWEGKEVRARKKKKNQKFVGFHKV